MSTVPVPLGAVAVIVVGETTVNADAAVPPKVTAVAALKFDPAMLTIVPPAPGPDVGLIDVTAGAGI